MAENPTKVVTGKVRLSYAHIFEPQKNTLNPEAKPKYSTVILIPKTDKTTLTAIKKAQQAALELGKTTKFKGAIPKNWTNTLHDGDEEADLDKNPEYAGHYYMTVANAIKPGVVDRKRQVITDPTEVYSGCYARVSINCFPFNFNGNKGVSFGLNNLQKLEDGQQFGGGASAEDDFEPLDDEDEEEDDFI